MFEINNLLSSFESTKRFTPDEYLFVAFNTSVDQFVTVISQHGLEGTTDASPFSQLMRSCF